MKNAIHPTYYSEATVHCSGCDRTFTVGSTREKIQVELCSNCHPFYTGKQKLVDTAGRVDRFRARQAKAEQSPSAEASAATEPLDETTTDSDEATRLAEMKRSLEQDDAQ